MVDTEACRVCRFWLAPERSAGAGHCRRYAPKPNTEPIPTQKCTEWPLTLRDDWCGEFEERTHG
jgi:hypothetical protein